MNIKQLQCLCALADTLSFTRAAEIQFMSQSAFSRQIAALEKEIGCPLIIRSRKNPQLTQAGERIVQNARSILQEAQSIELTAERAVGGHIGDLRLGVLPFGMTWQITFLFRDYLAENSENRIEISEYDENELVRALELDRADISIIIRNEEINTPTFEYLVLDRRPQCVVVSSQHPLACRSSVMFEELKNESFIIVKDDVFGRGYEYIMQMGLNRHFIPNIVAKADSLFSIGAYVNCNQGIAIAADLLSPYYGPDVRFIPIDDLEPLEHHLVWLRSNRSVPLRNFIKFCKSRLDEG